MTNSFDFKWLKSRISIQQVLSAYQLDDRLKQKNDTLCAPCPLHGGNNPTAFRVELNRGLWHCFTHCGGGDIVELVRHIESSSYPQAARSLYRLIGPKNVMHSGTTCSSPEKSFVPFTHKLILNPNVSFLQKQKNISVNTAIHHQVGIASHSRFLQNMVAIPSATVDVGFILRISKNGANGAFLKTCPNPVCYSMLIGPNRIDKTVSSSSNVHGPPSDLPRQALKILSHCSAHLLLPIRYSGSSLLLRSFSSWTMIQQDKKLQHKSP
jgi:CHC2 zinc finger